MKLKIVAAFLALGTCSTLLAGQAPSDSRSPLLRHYTNGETLVYRMKGVNEDWHYEIQADGIVKMDSTGVYFEEYRWSNMLSDHEPVVLSPASVDFRQQLSLDPNFHLRLPNLGQVVPKLIGPITDLMTFYADLWLAAKVGQLIHPGDHVYVKNGVPSSWADGAYVPEALAAIDHLLRDFRNGEVHAIEPRLLDLLSVLHAKLETVAPFDVISGYRSPATNAMLHAEHAGVAAKSLHMQGMAIDIRVADRALDALHATALGLRAGGVGYYPQADFVHVDVGRVRRW